MARDHARLRGIFEQTLKMTCHLKQKRRNILASMRYGRLAA
jgi:hypothetical protein